MVVETNVARIEPGKRAGFVALIGPTNAGKSTLLNSLLGTKLSIVSPKPQTTRQRILGVKTQGQVQTVFVDTPGFFQKIGGSALSGLLKRSVREGVDGVDLKVLVLDSERMFNENYLADCEKSLSEFNVKDPELIVLNKIDKVETPQVLNLLASCAERFTGELIPLAALPGTGTSFHEEGVRRLMENVSSRLPESEWLFPPEMKSNQGEQFLAAEVVREKLFLELHDELPYSSAVAVELWQERDTDLTVGAQIMVERESQKGIVIGKGGEMLKRIGIAARRDLEASFGKKVNLKLHVRVEERWSHSDRGLMRVQLG